MTLDKSISELIKKYHSEDNTDLKVWNDGEVTRKHQSNWNSGHEDTVLHPFTGGEDYLNWPCVSPHNPTAKYAMVTVEGANAIRTALAKRALETINHALTQKVS